MSQCGRSVTPAGSGTGDTIRGLFGSAMADIDEEAEEMLVEWFIILSGKVCIITSLEIFGNHEIK